MTDERPLNRPSQYLRQTDAERELHLMTIADEARPILREAKRDGRLKSLRIIEAGAKRFTVEVSTEDWSSLQKILKAHELLP